MPPSAAPQQPDPRPPAYSGVLVNGEPPPEEDHKKGIGTAILGVLIAIVSFGGKLKGLLLLLPKLKLFTTSASMLVSIGAYSLIWGWKFAAGFVLLLLIHEMGHVIQLRREGIPASAPMFIPFLGAVVAAKSLGDNAAAEARVGLAGPVLGTAAAAAMIPLAEATGNEMFTALAFTGFFLNLFNLLPIVPLDGGRAMAALSPRAWWFGFAGLVALTFVFPNPIMLLILLFGGMEGWRRWKIRNEPEQLVYYKVSPKARFAVAAVYLGLVLVLVIGMQATHIVRDFGDV